MASQSSVGSDAATKRRGEGADGNAGAPNADPYILGWSAMTRLMHQGYSWSGHERKCCFLNLGDGRFANGSAGSGLDFDDDGRAVAVSDWDGDGDLDLWMKNRTGPQLRFHRNESGNDAATGRSNLSRSENSIELELIGVTCNRDAIGARVEVRAGGRRFVRSVTAGDGYLSQSSKRLHFGLGTATTIESVTVQWPGGPAQILSGISLGSRIQVKQGAATLVELPRSAGLSRERMTESAPVTPKGHRLILRVPLPLSPELLVQLGAGVPPTAETGKSGSATLVALWAQWCAPCMAELTQLAEHSKSLQREGVAVVAVNVDDSKDQDAAEQTLGNRLGPLEGTSTIRRLRASASLKAALEALLIHIRGTGTEIPLPVSLLLDKEGSVQLVHVGAVEPKSLIEDVQTYGGGAVRPAARNAYPGRWYFKVPRDYAGLAADLTARGCSEEARFYQSLATRGPARE